MPSEGAASIQRPSAFAALVVNQPRAVIAVVLLATIFFALGLRRGLLLDVSPLGFVGAESQARADFDAARRNFGGEQYLIVAVVCDDVFASANLARLRKLHEALAAQRGVQEILSLSNVPYARSVADGAALEKLIPDGSPTAARLAEARAVALSDRLYAGNVVSADARMAALNILLNHELSTPERHAVTQRIYTLARAAGFAEVFFAGDPFSQWHGTEAIKSDLRLFLPLTLLLIALVLWLSFRSMAAVVLPLLTIGLGLLWLLGLMAWLGAHFTILALMLPTLMLAIGCSYLIHVINQIGIVAERAENKTDARAIIAEALSFITLPVVVSALTIIAGFLSLAFTEIPAIRATAVYAAAGAAFTMILSLTFVPAVLVLTPRAARSFHVDLKGKLAHLLVALGEWATRRQMLLYLVTALVVFVSFVGMWRIFIDIDYFHFHKPESETSVGLAEINRRLAGAVSFDLIVEGPQAGALEDVQTLARLAELQAFAESRAGVDRALSVVDFLKHLNRAFNDNRAEFYALPTDPDVVQELLAQRDQFRGFLAPDGRSARVLVRSRLSNSRAMGATVAEIERRGRELLPGLRVYATGTFVLLNRTSDQIAGEQRQSIALALLTIFVMLALLFRSWRVGLTALVPNLIPVLFFFGFMGWRGIPLNLTTSLVASVVLGLAVDNAVQFIIRFRRVQSAEPELRAAIIESMRLSGRPIIYANVALAVTFAIFALSQFEPVGSFGLLSAVTIMGCLLEDLILLPARLTSPVFKAK